MSWTCKISTVFCIFWIMGTCVASHLIFPRSCHCVVLVRGICFCLFTEMLWTVSMDYTRCISIVPSERFGLLELSFGMSMYCSSRISTCLSNWVILACRIVVGSMLCIRHCLEDLGFVSYSAQQLSCQMCWLWIEFSFCSHDWSLSWTIGFVLCTMFLMISDCFTSTEFSTCSFGSLLGSCLETVLASDAFAICCGRLRIFDDLLHHSVCVSWLVDVLYNDSFWDSLPSNAVTNSNDSFCDPRNWYVHHLLGALCVVNVAPRSFHQLPQTSEVLKGFLTDGIAWSSSFLWPTITTFWLADFVRKYIFDFVIFLDVLHLRFTLTNNVIVQRITRAFRQNASLRRGDTLQCCWWSSSLSQLLQRTDRSDFVFSGKSNSPMVSFIFTMSVMSVIDFHLAITQDQLLDILLLHQSQRCETCFLSKWTFWTCCRGASRSSFAESLAGSLAELLVALGWFLKVFLSPSSVVASWICGLNETALYHVNVQRSWSVVV